MTASSTSRCGSRSPDRHFQVCETADEAVQMAPPGRIEVIANYTAFQDLRRRVGN